MNIPKCCIRGRDDGVMCVDVKPSKDKFGLEDGYCLVEVDGNYFRPSQARALARLIESAADIADGQRKWEDS